MTSDELLNELKNLQDEICKKVVDTIEEISLKVEKQDVIKKTNYDKTDFISRQDLIKYIYDMDNGANLFRWRNADEIKNGLKRIIERQPTVFEEKEKRKFNIIVDKHCNQHCKYCEHSYTKYPNRTDDEIFNNFDLVMTKLEELFGVNNFRPQLQGGELTIFSKDLIDRICDRLQCYDEVLIFSNGYDRGCRFYTEKNFKVVTHIIDWYSFDISKFPILPNETLAFCITHDEICRVENLISTATRNEKILLLPCWSDNPTWNCTKEDKIYLSDLQNKYDGVEKDSFSEEQTDLCDSMRIPLIDCVDKTYTACGFIPDPKPIETMDEKNINETPCKKLGNEVLNNSDDKNDNSTTSEEIISTNEETNEETINTNEESTVVKIIGGRKVTFPKKPPAGWNESDMNKLIRLLEKRLPGELLSLDLNDMYNNDKFPTWLKIQGFYLKKQKYSSCGGDIIYKYHFIRNIFDE